MMKQAYEGVQKEMKVFSKFNEVNWDRLRKSFSTPSSIESRKDMLKLKRTGSAAWRIELVGGRLAGLKEGLSWLLI